MEAKIQFIKGLDEKVLPDVRLTRSRDGSTGTATFRFKNPNILDKNTTIIAVEAATGYEWYKFADAVYGMNSFGASGKANELFDHFGFTPQKLANFASELI